MSMIDRSKAVAARMPESEGGTLEDRTLWRKFHRECEVIRDFCDGIRKKDEEEMSRSARAEVEGVFEALHPGWQSHFHLHSVKRLTPTGNGWMFQFDHGETKLGTISSKHIGYGQVAWKRNQRLAAYRFAAKNAETPFRFIASMADEFEAEHGIPECVGVHQNWVGPEGMTAFQTHFSKN